MAVITFQVIRPVTHLRKSDKGVQITSAKIVGMVK